jgi:hypothetical protein
MATQDDIAAITTAEYDTCLGGYQEFALFAIVSNASAEAEGMSVNYPIIEVSTDPQIESEDEHDKGGAP